MSKIDELLRNERVEWRKLGEVAVISKGRQFNKRDMLENGTYPVINGGILPSGYIDVFNSEENTITVSQGGASAGFVNFIREQGVVGMAVGLAIGTAAGDTVKKLVTAFVDPLVQLIVGSQQGLQSASFTVEVAGRKGEFLYGAFVSSLITLIAVAFVVYAIIHFLKLDKLDKKKD